MRLFAGVGALALAVSLAGCGGMGVNVTFHGEPKHEPFSVEKGSAEMARVELHLGAGELELNGGSTQLMDGTFGFNGEEARPRVESHVTGFRADVKVSQQSGVHVDNNNHKWDIRLNDTVPIDLVTNLGAGEARMNLGSTTLRSLSVHMGVGQLKLDLRGKVKNDFDVEVNGGVGEADIRLPADAAISASASGGIGEINVQGLEKKGDRWFNPRQERGAKIHLTVHGGIGQIHIVAE